MFLRVCSLGIWKNCIEVNVRVDIHKGFVVDKVGVVFANKQWNAAISRVGGTRQKQRTRQCPTFFKQDNVIRPRKCV